MYYFEGGNVMNIYICCSEKLSSLFNERSKQVEETLVKRCQDMEQEAKEQATDNAILEQLRKVTNIKHLKQLHL